MYGQTEPCSHRVLKDVEQSGTWSSKEEHAVCTANCFTTCLRRNHTNHGTSIYERNYSQMQLESCGRSSRGASHWDCAPQRQSTPHKCYSYASEFCPDVVPHLGRSGVQRLMWTIVEVMENLEQSGTSSSRENLRGRFLGRTSSESHRVLENMSGIWLFIRAQRPTPRRSPH